MNELLSAAITLHVASISKPGGRQINEDAHEFAVQGPLACFAVSDGVGGEAGGELAAHAVVKTIVAGFKAQPAATDIAMAGYLDAAKTEVACQQAKNAAHKNMSATVAVVLMDCLNAQAQWAHLGDTRIYQFREGHLYRMTKDHSAVQQLVDAGYCAAEKVRTHPLRSSLLGAIGIADDSSADFSRHTESIDQGDAVFVCTDGFWEWITETEMEAALRDTHNVEDWLNAMDLIARKNSSSSPKPRDNYTGIAIRVGGIDPLHC